MTLKTICQNALLRMSGFEVPDSFYGNSNLTARTCLSLVTQEMKTLEREHRWSELITTYTFSTVAGTEAYSMPSDFRAFGNQSNWDRTHSRRMVGPAMSAEWQWLKGWIAAGATVDRWWRISGGYFYVHPVPAASGDTLAYDYYSKNTVQKQSDSTYTDDWTSDLDTSRLDEELLTLGLKWRFLQAKGMPFEPEYKEYEDIKDHCLADNGGKRLINFGPPTVVITNLPDRGYGP